ncbi:hypothetical protein HPP92_004546 [Vanilla planifolia]|uniref:UspA domain-containing protein n=1 Tax=Vanilla planifolia TaxID=51239 RepID=A0A835VCD9_VANPL|nr:hypothetical protein HPP92_004546 [Vanilla planifolia]
MGRRIVVAVDEGEESLHALTWCLKNVILPSASAQESSSGGDEGDVLVLVYAPPPRLYYPAMDGTGYIFSTDIITSMENYANELAKSVIAKAEMVCAEYPNVKVETKVKDGDPRM